MTTERQAAKADAADVDLRDAERAADLWLALALRKLADDPAAMDAASRAVDGTSEFIPLSMQDVVRVALQGIADHLEGGEPDGSVGG